jgi:hypothetical protein
VLDRAPSDPHGVGHVVEPALHGLDHRLMLPALDAALLAGGALVLDAAGSAGVGPVGEEHHILLDRREAPCERLAGRASIGVARSIVGEVLFAPAPVGLGPRCQGLGDDGVDADLVAGSTSAPEK